MLMIAVDGSNSFPDIAPSSIKQLRNLPFYGIDSIDMVEVIKLVY